MKEKTTKEEITLKLVGGGEIEITQLNRNDFLAVYEYEKDENYPSEVTYLILNSQPVEEDKSIILMGHSGIQITESRQGSDSLYVLPAGQQMNLWNHLNYKIAVLGKEVDSRISRLLYMLISLNSENQQQRETIQQLRKFSSVLQLGLGINPNVLSERL